MENGADGRGRVILCGAGIAGLTLAWWLDKTGWDVLLVEKAPGLRDEGYMIDFLGSGYDVAERMGLLPALEAARYDIPRVINVDDGGQPVSHLDYESFRRLADGRLLSLMRGDLERILYDALSEDVEIRYGLTIDAVEQDGNGVTVRLSDGATEDAALLVGADGIHSRVRELVFGEESEFIRPLGYHTAAYIFEDESFQRKLHGEFRNITVPDRTAGFYPIRDGNVATWFAFRTDDETRPSSPCRALQQQFGDLGWAVPAGLEYCSHADGVYYDTVAQIEMDHWSRGRVTLVGDACYAVSLLAGQGASMAMGGSYVLAKKLQGDGPIEEHLAEYEATMKPNVERKQAAGRRMAGFLIPPTPWHITVRNVVLRLSSKPGLNWLLKPAFSGMDSVIAK
jgi:2-polyprenyl-6-methoxyphenol hydroxylase-like FAD-dependent oxidoreductase